MIDWAMSHRTDGTRSVSIEVPKPKTYGSVVVKVWSIRRDEQAWSTPVVSFESAWDGFDASFWPIILEAVAAAFREFERRFGEPS